MPNLDAYWAKYDDTLKRVREEKPADLAALKVILDSFSAPSSGVAFFPNGADDQLDDALIDAGWSINYIEADYLWQAKSPTGERIHFVEGDIHEGRWEPVL